MVRVLQPADGSRVLRLGNLRTSNGPRLQVWLTDAPVVEGRAGWYLFDDGRHVDLGDLEGNIGSSNYPIPAGVDLDGPHQRQHLVRQVRCFLRGSRAEMTGRAGGARGLRRGPVTAAALP